MDKNLLRLFQGADDKHYSLPADLTQLRAAHDRLSDLQQPAEPVHPEKLWPELVAAATRAFVAGEDLPDVSGPLEQATAARERFLETGRLHREIEQRVTEALHVGVGAVSDQIITEHLQPALAALVVDLVPVAKALPQGASASLLITEGKALRDAWVKLGTLTDRYASIRSAQGALWSRQRVEHDVEGEFSEFSNVRAFFPQFGATNVLAVVLAPWPDAGPDRLLWLAQHGAQFIVPTAAERDQLWWAKHGEGVERQRQSSFAMEGYRAIGAA